MQCGNEGEAYLQGEGSVVEVRVIDHCGYRHYAHLLAALIVRLGAEVFGQITLGLEAVITRTTIIALSHLLDTRV